MNMRIVAIVYQTEDGRIAIIDWGQALAEWKKDGEGDS